MPNLLPRTARTAAVAACACLALASCQPRSKSQPEVKIPSGTTITVALDQPLRTTSNAVGDEFISRTTEPIVISGMTALPAGAPVRGKIVDVEKPDDYGGKPRMTLAFEEIIDASGDDKDLNAAPIALIGGDEKGQAGLDDVIRAIKGPGELIGGDGGIHDDSAVAVPTEDYHLARDAGQRFAIQLESDLEVALVAPNEPPR